MIVIFSSHIHSTDSDEPAYCAVPQSQQSVDASMRPVSDISDARLDDRKPI